jgi:cytochrome c oxidase cbb3-type subunit 4
MDTLNELRTIITVVAFVTFLGIVLWAWSGRRQAAFAQASRIPLDDDDLPHEAGLQTGSEEAAGVERSGT